MACAATSPRKRRCGGCEGKSSRFQFQMESCLRNRVAPPHPPLRGVFTPRPATSPPGMGER
jgi:hypothetical protein